MNDEFSRPALTVTVEVVEVTRVRVADGRNRDKAWRYEWHSNHKGYNKLERPLENNTLTNVTIQLGTTAFLHCPVRHSSDRGVSEALSIMSCLSFVLRGVHSVCDGSTWRHGELNPQPLPLTHAREQTCISTDIFQIFRQIIFFDRVL